MYFEARDEYGGDWKKGCCSYYDRALMDNYMWSLATLYRAYWRVLLPYRFEIRPLAVCFTGTNYMESMINDNFAFCRLCRCKKVFTLSLVHMVFTPLALVAYLVRMPRR